MEGKQKNGTFEDFSKKKTGTYPRLATFTVCEGIFFLVEALGMPPGVFWGMLEVSWSNLACVLRYETKCMVLY